MKTFSIFALLTFGILTLFGFAFLNISSVDMIQNDMHAVVYIEGDNSNDSSKAQIGTGFFIGENRIITNNHVINGTDKIKIRGIDNTRSYDASIVEKDEFSDVAVLSIDDIAAYKAENTINILKFANMRDIKPAQTVWVVGNPWNLTWSVSKGIVSAVSRRLGNMLFYVQTDAHLFNGNSGGPLITDNNEVIGINNIMLSREGGSYGFTLPSNIILKSLSDMDRFKNTYWARMGLMLEPNTGKDRLGVRDISPGSAAEKYGIKPNDFIISIATKYTNYKPVQIHLYDRLQDLLTLVDRDETIDIVVQRDGKEILIPDILPIMVTGNDIMAEIKAAQPKQLEK